MKTLNSFSTFGMNVITTFGRSGDSRTFEILRILGPFLLQGLKGSTNLTQYAIMTPHGHVIDIHGVFTGLPFQSTAIALKIPVPEPVSQAKDEGIHCW